jgi:hypothetical protein
MVLVLDSVRARDGGRRGLERDGCSFCVEVDELWVSMEGDWGGFLAGWESRGSQGWEEKGTQLDVDVVSVKGGDKAQQIVAQLDVNVGDLDSRRQSKMNTVISNVGRSHTTRRRPSRRRNDKSAKSNVWTHPFVC